MLIENTPDAWESPLSNWFEHLLDTDETDEDYEAEQEYNNYEPEVI